MSVQLEAEEQRLRDEIEAAVKTARKAFASTRLDDNLNQTILKAGSAAHNLHKLLKARGQEPKHHSYMTRLPVR